MPLNYDDVRLVYPLLDPETGEIKDTVIANLETVKIYYDRDTNRSGWRRAVAGESIIIPWPKTEPKERTEYDADTRRLDVENKTFRPTLLKCPLPRGVIDELRNKYSSFRTRHEETYIAQKFKEEKEQAQKVAAIKTPIQELNKKLRVERRALGPPELSEDMLERIGRVMAQNKPEALGKVLANAEIY